MKTISTLSSIILLAAIGSLGCVGAPGSDEDTGDDTLLDLQGDDLSASEDTDAVERLGEASDALVACAGQPAWQAAWETWEDEVRTLVNQKRAAGAKCGGTTYPPAPALAVDNRLRCSARRHSRDMGVNNFMNHIGSDGSEPWDRMEDAGYAYTQAAENIAVGYNSPAAVVNGWMGSVGHCQNIMKATLKHLGVGYYRKDGSTYVHHWTQNFGRQ
ncbi:CAP domain-containing protein [Chondromyces apiculatus]|uniref:SCP domain-containing protein n=1 Tax=Chondromyces apiculatus DSM 436 TaxID=1192034 RepID=A0A017TAR2_9BACT|nr:CAP domain-containing protein [Chondromyces apiculatus]EYF05696.1 Hypothetical protein CAP_2986 [Chondromyces apiculatus DSM 436]